MSLFLKSATNELKDFAENFLEKYRNINMIKIILNSIRGFYFYSIKKSLEIKLLFLVIFAQ